MSSPASLSFHQLVILGNGNRLSFFNSPKSWFPSTREMILISRQMGILATLWFQLWDGLYYLILDILKRKGEKEKDLEILSKDQFYLLLIFLTPLYFSIQSLHNKSHFFFYKSSFSPNGMYVSGRKGPMLWVHKGKEKNHINGDF